MKTAPGWTGAVEVCLTGGLATAQKVGVSKLRDVHIAEDRRRQAEHTGRQRLIWSPQQEAALKSATRWFRERDKQVYRLFGFAGTGKTELARELGSNNTTTHYAAFTGKAGHVLRQRGCEPVSTIHSLIYRA
jgi:hypothetical protein